MMLRVTCLTPPNQAAKCIDSQKWQILGNDTKRLKAQKLLAHDRFYWDVEVDDNRYHKIIRKCASAEVNIKNFYKFLLKAYDMAWKKEKKLQWGFRKMKNLVLKKMKKAGYQQEGFLADLSKEDDEGFFNVIDAEEMKEFIKQDLIEVKTL